MSAFYVFGGDKEKGKKRLIKKLKPRTIRRKTPVAFSLYYSHGNDFPLLTQMPWKQLHVSDL